MLSNPILVAITTQYIYSLLHIASSLLIHHNDPPPHVERHEVFMKVLFEFLIRRPSKHLYMTLSLGSYVLLFGS